MLLFFKFGNLFFANCNILGFVWVHEVFIILCFWQFNNFSIFAKTWYSCLRYFFVETHETTWPLWRSGIFFPLHTRGFGCSVTTEWTWIAFRIFKDAPFSVVLLEFARNRGLPIAQKSGYASCVWGFFSNFCTKLDQHCGVLLALSVHCLQCS